MGRLIVEVTCPRCWGLVEMIDGPSPLRLYWLCPQCCRHYERWEVCAKELDMQTGELIELAPCGPGLPVRKLGPRFSYGAAVEWYRCSLCEETVTLLRLSDASLVVIDRDGMVHRDWCPGLAHMPVNWVRLNAEQIDLELAGQLPLFLTNAGV